MMLPLRLLVAMAATIVPAVVSATLTAGPDKPTPSISAVPMIAPAPAKILMRVALRGGADDDPDFYCVTVEWDWDDGSVSERTRDCDPYEKGKSRIDRLFTAEHEFKLPDEYKVTFRLKRGDKVLTAASLTVTIT
jgi:hypothetical protein